MNFPREPGARWIPSNLPSVGIHENTENHVDSEKVSERRNPWESTYANAVLHLRDFAVVAAAMTDPIIIPAVRPSFLDPVPRLNRRHGSSLSP